MSITLCYVVSLKGVQREKEKIKDIGSHGIEKWGKHVLEEVDECHGWKRVMI